jgi:hypothetical protein
VLDVSAEGGAGDRALIRGAEERTP